MKESFLPLIVPEQVRHYFAQFASSLFGRKSQFQLASNADDMFSRHICVAPRRVQDRTRRVLQHAGIPRET